MLLFFVVSFHQLVRVTLLKPPSESVEEIDPLNVPLSICARFHFERFEISQSFSIVDVSIFSPAVKAEDAPNGPTLAASRV
jgi:hypothetical protein